MQQKQSISINIEDINKTAKEHVANNNIQFEKKSEKFTKDNKEKKRKKKKNKKNTQQKVSNENTLD